MYEMNDEVKEYLIYELNKQRIEWLLDRDNNYDYILMICNDLGIDVDDYT
jgi:hypothetical protein